MPATPATTPEVETPVPMTVARPARQPSGMGLRARPSGLGSRLRSIFVPDAAATDATWDEVEEALIAADVGGTAIDVDGDGWLDHITGGVASGHSSTANAGLTSSISGQWLLRLRPKTSAIQGSSSGLRGATPAGGQARRPRYARTRKKNVFRV